MSEYDIVKGACVKLMRINGMECSELKEFANHELDMLNEYYFNITVDSKSKLNRMKSLIEKSIYIASKSSNVYNLRGFVDFDKYRFDGKYTFILFLLEYCNKKSCSFLNKYFSYLDKLDISSWRYKRFLSMYVLFKYDSIPVSILKCIVLDKRDKRCLSYLLKIEDFDKTTLERNEDLIYMTKAVEGYGKLLESVVYDDDSLKKVCGVRNKVKRSLLYVCGNNECVDEVFNQKVSSFSNNFVSINDLKCVKKFKFKSHIVQNTVFVKSSLDNWLVEVDKPSRECILFHNNDGYPDDYHYQKTFNHVNLYKVFRYIKEHDEYSLKRFDRKFKKDKRMGV